MDGPGMSLFQGAGSIHINNDAQARMEAENLEDQKRRNAELNVVLEHAFDDLIEEDDISSVNSSSNFPSCNLNQISATQRGENGGAYQHHYESEQGFQDMGDQYKNAYSPMMFRNHLMEDITPQKDLVFGQGIPYMQTVTNGHAFDNKQQVDYNKLLNAYQQVVNEIEEMRGTQTSIVGQLTIATSERDQAELSLRQVQELLVESKLKEKHLEKDVSDYKQTKLELDTKIEELNAELAASSASLADCQHRLQTAKLNSQTNNDHLFKMQKERHKEEVDRLHEDLEKARNRLAEKNKEVLEAERRAKDSEKGKEDLLIDKGSTINRLAAELEQAHIQLEQAKKERNTSRKQVKELGSKLEKIALELSTAREEKLMVESALDGTLAATNISASMVTSTPTAAKEKVNIVKMNLMNCLHLLKQKEEQLENCSQTVSEKEQQIKKQRESFEKQMSQIDTVSSHNTKLKNEVKILQHQLELFKSNSRSELLEGYKLQNEELEKQIANLKKELKTVQLQHCEVEMELGKLKLEKSKRKSLERDANSNLVVELDHLTSQLGESRKEVKHFRALYIEMCAAKEQMLAEMIQLRNSDIYLKLEEEKQVVKELQSKIRYSREEVERLKESIQKLEDSRRKVSNAGVIERIDSPCQTDEEIEKFRNSTMTQTEQEDGQHNINNFDNALTVENLMKDLEIKNKKIEALQIDNDTLMDRSKNVDELRSRAKQFEAYLMQHYTKLANKRDVFTETDSNTPIIKSTTNAATNTEESVQLSMNNDRPVEDAKSENIIRQEVAEYFALELNNLESDYKNKLTGVEQQNRDNFVQLKQMVQGKVVEVQFLEALVIAERKKARDLLMAKEAEVANRIRENGLLFLEVNSLKDRITDCNLYKDKIDSCEGQVMKLKQELAEKKKALLKEKGKILKMEHEIQLLQAQRNETKESDKQLEALKEKYKAIKRRALNYKEYANEKDRHVKNELDRIKTTYESALSRLQAKLDAVLSTKEIRQPEDMQYGVEF